MTGEGQPTPLTCDRCGAAFDRDTAVAYLQDRRVVHGRPDECVAAFRRLVAALEEENAGLKRQLEESSKYKAFYDVHFPDTAADPPVVSVTVSSTGPLAPSTWVWRAGDDPLFRATAVPTTPPVCLECGRPAEVEVAPKGQLRQLYCWEHSGCKERYWLPDRWACFQCGKAASAQATHGDGLTRPLCPWCAGVEDVGEEE